MTKNKSEAAQTGHLASGGPLTLLTREQQVRGARRSVQAKKAMQKLAAEPVVLGWGKHGK